MNQRGFATLEVILMVVVIGILASIAVPRFTSVTAAANTAKIQADLTTLDTAIAIYQMEKGTLPSAGTISALSDYVRGADSTNATLTPPSGKCYMGSATAVDVPATSYTIAAVDGEMRAVCGDNNTAEKFYMPKKTTSN